MMDAVALAYVDGSTAELAGGVVLTEILLFANAALTQWRWMPHLRTIDRWMTGDTSQEPAKVWRVVTRQPMASPLTGFPLGLFGVALPLAVYTWTVLDASAGEAAIIFAALLTAGLYAAVALYFATELYLRPVLRDVAARLPADFQLTRPRLPLAWKLMAALLLTTVGAGGLVAVIATAANGSFSELALLLGVTVALTLTTTLLIAVMITGSITTPVDYLVDATKRVRSGDLQARVPITSDDELGVLAGSFNEMTEDLQRSRGRLVTTREEERRRLRRDLHDGLGPALAGVAMQLDAATGLIDADPERAKKLIAELRSETSEAIADIRRLVHDLRPPQLDDLGLVGAIEERAARLAAEGDGASADGLKVTVEAPPELPALPAAVEVAAYRIAQEALANVVRHSGARACTIRLALNGWLELQVRDDGSGMSEHHDPGVGLSSMRERAAELGGVCTVEPGEGGGTVVYALLPLP
jgi:signal transduction histidine kinase